jgi:hypothetical protein
MDFALEPESTVYKQKCTQKKLNKYASHYNPTTRNLKISLQQFDIRMLQYETHSQKCNR